MNSFSLPSYLGAVPPSIPTKSVGTLKAEQLINWVLYYSGAVLASANALPTPHFLNWSKFIRACQILTRQRLPIADLDRAHDLLKEYCHGLETLSGITSVTINHHLNLHLRECILDYGPLFAIWLFSFERYNGTLGNYNNNHLTVEATMMRRFQEGEMLEALIRWRDETEAARLLPEERTFLEKVSPSSLHLYSSECIANITFLC